MLAVRIQLSTRHHPLPLQKKPREADHSVFVDDDLGVYPGQWAFLASIESMALQDIEAEQSES